MAPRTVRFDRSIFIGGPFKNCPNSVCVGQGTFGVFTPVGGSTSYMRECTKCGYQRHFPLPEIKKRIVYLDQFVISNLVKLLDKDNPSHARIKSDPFWEALFKKLERAAKSQAIVCPDSLYHRSESLTGRIDFQLMRRLYEHLSSGKTLYSSTEIEEFQIANHFKAWLGGKKATFDLNPDKISHDDLHSWSVGLQISVGGASYPGELESLKQTNLAAKNQLKQIWAKWQTEKDVSFIERVKQETLEVGRVLIGAAVQFERNRNAAIAKAATSADYEPSLDDLLPPQSNNILEFMLRITAAEGMSQEERFAVIAKYFADADALLEVPSIKITSVMFAALARRAALGKKEPPKSTTDVQFIASYLPYCDAVFVDKESAALLTELPKGVPAKYRLSEFAAKVFSLNNKDAFLAYLEDLVDRLPHDQIAIVKDVSGDQYAEPYWSIIEREKAELSKQ